MVRNLAILFLLTSRLPAQTEATHRFDYPAEYFSIELPASAKEIDSKTASILGSAMGQLVPKAPQFQAIHAYTASDLSTQAVLVMVTDKPLNEAPFRNLPNATSALNNQVPAVIAGSPIQSLAAENASYDKERHALWATTTTTSQLTGRMRAVVAMYLTRVGTIAVQCNAKEADFSRYEQECTRIVHSVVIDPSVVLVSAPSLSQLLAVAPAEAEATYRELTARVKGGDFSVDFRILRLACVKAPSCSPGGTPAEVESMKKAASERRFGDVVEIGRKLLDEGFVNIEAHSSLPQAYNQLKKPQEAQFHMKVFVALLEALLNSGDGKSAATAYEVVSASEKLMILQAKHMPVTAELSSFQPLTEGGHRCEKWTVKHPATHTEEIIFFNVDAIREK